MRITKATKNKIYKATPCSVETMELLGYEFIENLFVDSSGFGQDDEAAMTQDQLMARLDELLDEYGQLTAKISGVGMFQVNIGLYTKTGKKQAKRLSSNVLLIDRGDGKRVVRLYDTDIITENGDGTITLNTGGFNTMTTSKWMNRLSSAHVYRKNWEMYVGNYGKDDQKFNGDTITVDGWIRENQ